MFGDSVRRRCDPVDESPVKDYTLVDHVPKGYLDEERTAMEAFAREYSSRAITITHPRTAFQSLITAFDEHPEWLD